MKKENKFLNKIINTFEKTVKKFIKWIAKKFDIAEEDDLIRVFEKETDTYINLERQIKYEKETEIEELE